MNRFSGTLLLVLWLFVGVRGESMIIYVDEDDSCTVSTVVYDGGVMAYSRTIEVHPLHGRLSGFTGGFITYYPLSNYHGTDGFTLKVKVLWEEGGESEWSCHYQVIIRKRAAKVYRLPMVARALPPKPVGRISA